MNVEKSSLLPKGSSRLPMPGLRLKRPASNENEPPKKRTRGPLEPTKRGAPGGAQGPSFPKPPPAASGLRSQRQAGGRRRSRGNAGLAGPSNTGSRQAVAAAAPKPAAAPATAGKGKKKRAPWDLKGQVSDLRDEVGAYKEKTQVLAGENESLKERLNQAEGELKQATGLNRQLEGKNRALALDLQTCQAQATERLQRVEQLVEQEQRLQETIQSQSQAIGELESAGRQDREAKEHLAAQLETREAELRLALESLAQRVQENEALAASKARVEQKLHESEMDRRFLHNAVLELKGNIRVFCRVRPLLSSEKEAQKQGMSHLRFPPGDSKSLVLSKAEESHVGRERKEDIVYEFNFDQVFPPSSSQEEVFEEISLLVQSALDGYHVCIFAYGQTGSGKTYTMEGPDCQDPAMAGMIPRAVQLIFKKAREMEAKGWQYHLTANFVEIYNESLRDLLVLRPERGSELEIRRVSQCTEELTVTNLSYIPVESAEEVVKLLQRAKAHRSVAKTNLNERSSRSHSLFQLRIEGHNANRELHTSSVLSLVDLAGSERLDKSLSTGDRLKETQAINSSLSTLGLVITALSNKEAHVPFRNSKLTYLLQNSLGGNSKMLMFVNISPSEENFGETLNSLRFARKVNECMIGTASIRK